MSGAGSKPKHELMAYIRKGMNHTTVCAWFARPLGAVIICKTTWCRYCVNDRLMGSGDDFYEYEILKDYDDIDVEPTVELGMTKIRRNHFKDEKFTHSVHSGRFDPD
ncbi:hypothetical protein PIB30_069359 [Stylosanthes scabra]|uniref:Uncharacterized protein n=1 Tax=Stylosanthes scabra TaxID=79078 RepID=A0ABU6QN51_9FABA|nr:hypothetical protein [Stylosanthes scabra]